MNRFVKILLGVLATLLVLIIVAAIALPLLFDPNAHKDEITAMLENRIGREISIPGEIDLSVFPWLGINIGRVAIANAPGFADEPMAEIQSAEVHVRLWPLLQQRIEIGTVSLEGLRLRLARNAEGETNWGDIVDRLTATEDTLATDTAPEAEETASPGGFRMSSLEIGAIDITDAAVSWNDALTGNSYKLSDFNLSTGRLTDDQPFRLEMGATLAAATQGITSNINMIAQVQPDISEGFYRFFNLSLNILAKGEAVPGGEQQLNLTGQGEYDVDAGRLKLGDLVLQVAGLNVVGYVDGSGLNGTPVFNGRLTVKQFDPRAVMTQLGIEPPVTQSGSALSSASFDAQFELTPERAEIEQMLLTLDSTTLKGSVGVRDFDDPAIVFDASLDTLDMDMYLPPGSAEQAQTPEPEGEQTAESGEQPAIDLSVLEDLRLDGKLQAGTLTIGNMTFTGASMVVTARDGVLTIAPLTAAFYGGDIRLSARVNAAADVPRYSVRGQLTDLQFAPLLQDVAGTDKVSALASMNLDLSTAGAKIAAMKRALNGQFSFELRDGAFNGFNLAKVIAAARSRIAGDAPVQTTDDKTAGKVTPFNRFAGTFNVDDGIVAGDGLRLDTKLLEASGVGRYDLAANVLDYTVNVRVDENGGGPLAELAGVTVPVHLSGNLLAPEYSVDIAAALKGLAAQRLQEEKAELKSKVQDELSEELEQLDSDLGERLQKGLSDLLGGGSEKKNAN